MGDGEQRGECFLEVEDPGLTAKNTLTKTEQLKTMWGKVKGGAKKELKKRVPKDRTLGPSSAKQFEESTIQRIAERMRSTRGFLN